MIPTAQLDVQMIVGGTAVEAIDGRRMDVLSPASGAVVGSAPLGSSPDVESAVAAATAAFPAWRRMLPLDRGRRLLAIADELEAEVEPLARILASETGNAIRTQSRPEVKGAADLFRYYGGLAPDVKGEVVPFGTELLYFTSREPYGVVAAIVAWNSPLMLAATKITMALMTGNTVVLKAPEDAPIAILRMAAIADRHLPPGTLNVLTGTGEEAGAALVRHPGVAKVTFTGSTEVGRDIAEATGARIVSTVLELGGKSPAIVCADSDTDEAADGVISGMRFTRQGQGCTAGSRLLIHEAVYESFLARLVRRLGDLRVGDPLDESTDIGCVINRTQYDRVCSYIKDGIANGGRVLLGGIPAQDEPAGGGNFLLPTVIADVQPDWHITREEIFGPVLVAMSWSTDSEALALANDTDYGLSGYVWCRDIGHALRLANGIEAGGVQINRGAGPLPGMSDGGIKQSGIGREHSLEAAVEEFTYRKGIAVGIGS